MLLNSFMEKTRKFSYSILFERVGFPTYEDLIECSAASWMQKMIYTLEPSMIIELIKFPRSQSNSTRFKRTAIN